MIKYTSDGKKVKVVGKLNAQETIVQEIFISDGNEIPSGENFVVKSLHDAPAISWKEKSLKDLEDRYNSESKDYQKKLEALRRDFDQKSTALHQHLIHAGAQLKRISEETFDVLLKFLTGQIKWVVIHDYYGVKIETYDNVEHDKTGNYGRCEKELRLLSIFGKDDGTLTYKINRYSDGSGSNDQHIVPFSDLESAKQYCQKYIDEKEVNGSIIKIAKDYDLYISPERMNKYNKKMTDELKKQVLDAEKRVEELKNQILQYEPIHT